MKINTYIQTIYEEHLKYDLEEFKPWGKRIMYPFWLLKIVYYYIFFLPFYPIVYLIYTNVTQEQVDAFKNFQERKEQMMLEFVAKLGNEINDGAKFLKGTEDE